jgi:hemoglobin-like flavoprotein
VPYGTVSDFSFYPGISCLATFISPSGTKTPRRLARVKLALGANPMTNEQKDLVQTSWLKVEPIADTAASLFYGRLFEIDPTTRPLFNQTDMAEQRKKLMQVIGIAVRGLDRPEETLAVVAELGKRHSGYGVTDEHYDSVGEALLWTLEKGLGDQFTPAVKDAWATVYGLLANTMKGPVATA